MGSPLYRRWAKLEERLDLRLTSLTLLRENRTCWIYRARASGQAVVVKQYKRHARELCLREAAAVRLYTRLCEEAPGLVASHVQGLNAASGTLCITFIEGELMSELLRKGGRSALEQSRCSAALERVSELLRKFRRETMGPPEPSPFLEEYLVHASRRLEEIPGLGTIFSGYVASALSLYEDLKDAGEPTSMSHGDLVCANLILCGQSVGLIDFANTDPRSHTLDDVYNLRVTCENLLHLPRSFRLDLAAALESRLDLERSDARAHRFYHEYHKRRWLHLQLSGGWARRARALALLPRMLHRPLQAHSALNLEH